jgi:hypothetical protein
VPGEEPLLEESAVTRKKYCGFKATAGSRLVLQLQPKTRSARPKMLS